MKKHLPLIRLLSLLFLFDVVKGIPHPRPSKVTTNNQTVRGGARSFGMSTQPTQPTPSYKERALQLIDEKFVQPAKELDDHEVAYAVGIGFWNGLLPLPGLTVPSQLAVLMVFKLFHKRLGMSPVQFTLSFAMHLVTGISTMEILMMAPYFNMGNSLSEYVLSERTTCSVTEMLDSWSANGLLETLKQLPACILLALGAWFLSGFIIVPVLYVGTRLALTGRGRNEPKTKE